MRLKKVSYDKSLISIIIPVYNAERYLRQCLNSICYQTYRNLEVICVDDGSTDSSINILQEYSLRDNRITFIKQHNKGAAIARNNGLAKSTGKYILFLDSDDFIEKSLCEKAINKAELLEADVIIYKAFTFNDINNKKCILPDGLNNYKKYFNQTFSAKDLSEDILNIFLPAAWNKIIKKELIEKHNIRFQNIKRTNDLFFTSKVLVNASKIAFLNEPLLYYRVGLKSNLQSGKDKSPLDFYKALLALKQYLDTHNLYILVEKSFVKLVFDVTFYNLISLKDRKTYSLIVNKLKKNGFQSLGITNIQNLKNISCTGYIQYKYLMMSGDISNYKIMKILYGIHKLWQYYKFTGIKNTINKLLMN